MTNSQEFILYMFQLKLAISMQGKLLSKTINATDTSSITFERRSRSLRICIRLWD